MLKRALLSMVLVMALASFVQAATVKGVDLPEQVTAADQTLVLNGAGVRSKKLVGLIKKDLYVAGLYLKNKSDDGAAIVAADEPMALRIRIISGLITSERFAEATREGFQESTQGDTAPIQKEIELFMSSFSDKIKNGDLIEIVYTPGVGVQTFKNGASEPIVTVPGMPIKKALFGIWLGERSEKELQKLAQELLGKSTVK